MYLKSVNGKILFEGRFSSLNNDLEMAIEDNTCLDYINLRHANLSGAALDYAQMDHACLWGQTLITLILQARALNMRISYRQSFKQLPRRSRLFSC